MSYEINLHFRRFGYGMGRVTGLNTYYIGLPVPFTARARPNPGPNISLILAQHLDLRPSARVPSPWTMTRSFVLSPTDLRAVQMQMFTSRAWGAQKYPSRGVDVIYS